MGTVGSLGCLRREVANGSRQTDRRRRDREGGCASSRSRKVPKYDTFLNVRNREVRTLRRRLRAGSRRKEERGSGAGEGASVVRGREKVDSRPVDTPVGGLVSLHATTGPLDTETRLENGRDGSGGDRSVLAARRERA